MRELRSMTNTPLPYRQILFTITNMIILKLNTLTQKRLSRLFVQTTIHFFKSLALIFREQDAQIVGAIEEKILLRLVLILGGKRL